MSSARYRIGVDLGGTKIEVVVLDASGAELFRKRVGTPRDDYGATLSAIVSLVRQAEESVGMACSVGVGTPGAISSLTGRMKNANSRWLNGQPLKEDLERLLGREIRMANDANCFALSEAKDGAGVGARVVFGVILGTGVGGGIVIDGRVLTGANSIAGEWGHNPLPSPESDDYPLPNCYCGRRGCIETYLSGPGMAALYQRDSGEHLLPAQIVERSANGDKNSQKSLNQYDLRLARALGTIINTLDPDVIVLGGGLSALPGVTTNTFELLGHYVFSDQVCTRLVRAKHGDSSGVRGAAWLWP